MTMFIYLHTWRYVICEIFTGALFKQSLVQFLILKVHVAVNCRKL